MKIKKRVIIIISTLIYTSFLISCASSEKTPENSDQIINQKPAKKVEQFAIEKYKNNYILQNNSSNTFTLCVKKIKSSDHSPRNTINYFVYDLSVEELIHEESIANGNVKWLNDHQIQISITPGTVKGDEKGEGEPTGYIYDTKLKKKIISKTFLPGINDS